MDIDRFVRRVNNMSSRLEALSKDANDLFVPRLDLLPAAFKELGMAAQELQLAAKELQKQQEELTAAQAIIAAERRRYYDLFELAFESYVVTDVSGKIKEVNRATTLLFELASEELIGKSLTDLLAEESRQQFNYNLARKYQKIKLTPPFKVNFRLPNGKRLHNIDINYSAIRDERDQIIGLRWLLRENTLQQQSILSSNSDDETLSDNLMDRYYKGELIPINYQEIYQVRQGVVKLSTMSDTGEEVLVGLASSSMPFGGSITSLNIYQATALTNNVELVRFPLTKWLDCPSRVQKLVPKLTSRLRQTELLLYISGQRRVKHRLHYLLQFLKQEIGQPVAQGTRLSVRFTHEELASACCATRVTTTRQLNKLREQGIITVDDEHHIILLN
ncbi:putative transcriptional regulator, Crp/Fnr family with PAS/PAC sensor [Gloeocapsa sp. PCC 7428]|nr:putative transcriptional regulator, Crp/Fnr family with PAS/PAC sensor [Gloeocapsa sp. PCC 7428]